MALIPQATYDRLYAIHERSLPDSGVAAFGADRWATTSLSFPCSLRAEGPPAGGRLDFEPGNAHGYRLRVGRAAPALRDGDRVTVTRTVRGSTETVTVQVVSVDPATTHQNAPSYGAKLL